MLTYTFYYKIKKNIMQNEFIRSILVAFSEVGPVEYKIMNDRVDIYKDNKIIARVQNNSLHAINDELCKKALELL